MSTPHAATPEVFDELDPHGFGGTTKHSHHIVSGMTLKSILGILLFFTVVTVAASQAEKWFEVSFAYALPRWVNVAVAMSIATIKATLVLMYFMLLRYSNPINTIVFLFCLLAFSLFLFFTLLDLGTRGAIDPMKAHAIEAGGTGNYTYAWTENPAVIVDKPAVVYWREKKIAAVGQARYDELKHVLAHGHGGLHFKAPTVSSGNASINRPGLTPGLFDATAPVAHEEGHSEHAPAAHDPAAKPEAPAKAEPAGKH